MNTLSDTQRALVARLYGDGLSNRQIAIQAGISRTTVRRLVKFIKAGIDITRLDDYSIDVLDREWSHKMRRYDPTRSQDYWVCDQCGAPATWHAGVHPTGTDYLVMDRCDAHALSDREFEALCAAAGMSEAPKE